MCEEQQETSKNVEQVLMQLQEQAIKNKVEQIEDAEAPHEEDREMQATA